MTEQEWKDKSTQEGYQGFSIKPLGPHEEIPEHTHDQETVQIMLAGELTVFENGQAIVFHEGDRMDIPAGTIHRARAGAAGAKFLAGTKNNIPRHLAIIPDGNRRWAKKRNLDPWLGHREGGKRFTDTLLEHAFQNGIKYLTFWAASVDNLSKRSTTEVKYLTLYLREELEKKETLEKLLQNQIKLRVIGKWQEVIKDQGLAQSIKRIEAQTVGFTERQVTILFGYDGISEMLEGIKQVRTLSGQLTYESFKQVLATGALPEVDLVVRTGGEPHWSAGFMMWLTANSQFYFTECLWPDFDGGELRKALDEYAVRSRRFGK